MVGKSAQQAISQSLISHARFSGELRHRHSRTVRTIDDHVTRCIVVLLNGCGPIAVGWLIVLLRIFSLNAVLIGRGAPHVCQKCAIALKPSVADLDSFRPVMPIGTLGFSIAPRLDPKPRLIFLSWTVPFAVRFLRLTGGFVRKASATSCVPLLKRSAVNDRFSSAITSAEPADEFPAMRPLPKHYQAAISNPSSINFSHQWIIPYPHRSSVCRAADM